MKFFVHTLSGRILLSLAVGMLMAAAMSEAAFYLLREGSDQPPQVIELVIPDGTAERVAAGESPPSIPSEMVFLVGDTLLVKNEDAVSHQLGPVWVPPGASASLAMGKASKFSYDCTFQPSRYLGLDVRSRVTLATRLQGWVLAGPPMGVLIAAYSLVMWPLRRGGAQAKSAA